MNCREKTNLSPVPPRPGLEIAEFTEITAQKEGGGLRAEDRKKTNLSPASLEPAESQR